MFEAFKRILSAVMSFIMIILAAFGVGSSAVTDAMLVGDWLAALCEEFGMASYENEEPYYEGITADSEYFAAVQTAYEWGIINAEDDVVVDAPLTNEFAAMCLVRAARLEAENVAEIKNANWLDYAQEVAIAVANGLFEISASGKFKVETLKTEDALKVLADAKTIWANKAFEEKAASYVVADGVKDLAEVEYAEENGKFVYDDVDLEEGDVFVNDQGAYEVKAVTEEDGKAVVSAQSVALEDAVDKVSLEGTVEANLDTAQVTDENSGEIVQDYDEVKIGGQGDVGNWIKDEVKGLIAKGIEKAIEAVDEFLTSPEISFSIKGFKVKVGYNAGTVALSVAGNIANNIHINKAYALSDITFSTKYDANLKKLKINEAYVIANYDLVETTVLTGSYAASVVPDETENEVDFLTRVKEGLFHLEKGSNVKFDVVKFNIPVGSTGLIITLKLSVTISAVGTIKIVVTSNETKGVEIINNHLRYISDSTIYDRKYEITGDFKLMLGIYIILNFLGYDIVDAVFQGGIGAYVVTRVYKENKVIAEDLEIPVDVYMEATAGNEAFDNTKFCVNVDLYGILKISVGENSLVDEIGLSDSWTIYDRSNATFAHWHIEDGSLMDACSNA